ncbi:sel1 repeat family protein [Pseudoalteromonas sp. McH1-7]|uniref:tetratricopeptide repeat protein n=1 Tax=unclassified Pseudoalteromonas TaxID=194690 RepID=UPI0015907B6A|nr:MULTISPECIES: sel1 repeat family protein [unclassified Pseudoalteromonas]NUZ12886.1 sel1 repeat family protein [Pseudoalteromonas sp. McH1-7]USD28629.1 sel1 repeat family protein [Pseudoalteromonas sp. SCSIO 43201]
MEIKNLLFSVYDTLFDFISRNKLVVTVFIALTVCLYFYHRQQQEISSYRSLLNAPEVDDIIIFDTAKRSKHLYEPAFQVLQVTALSDDHIEVKAGAFTYRTMRNITRDIRVSMLMTDRYFKPQKQTLEKSKLLDLLDNETIMSVYRPVGIHVLGGVVRPRFKKPKPLYHGPNISAQNQDAIRAYHREEFEAARQGFADTAKSGNPWGQYNYATMLRDGEGGVKDIPAAIHWLQLSAKQGNHKAKAALDTLCKTHHCQTTNN